MLEMRSANNLAIRLDTMRLATEALSGLLATASHLCFYIQKYGGIWNQFFLMLCIKKLIRDILIS